MGCRIGPVVALSSALAGVEFAMMRGPAA